MKNKKAWVRIVEAFIAILLIVGVLLIVINKGYVGKKDLSEKIYNIQKTILRDIELDNSLRQEIVRIDLEISESVELAEDINTYAKLENYFKNYPYLEWRAMVCNLDEICVLKEEVEVEKDIYAQAVAIIATTQEYNPNQLKLFCWEK